MKLAFEKRAAEDAKKVAKEKNELLKEAIDSCRNDFSTNLILAIIN